MGERATLRERERERDEEMRGEREERGREREMREREREERERERDRERVTAGSTWHCWQNTLSDTSLFLLKDFIKFFLVVRIFCSSLNIKDRISI